jgi:hypothetical protein
MYFEACKTATIKAFKPFTIRGEHRLNASHLAKAALHCDACNKLLMKEVCDV